MRRNFCLLMLACIATFVSVILLGWQHASARTSVRETPAAVIPVIAHARVPVAAPAPIETPPLEAQVPPAAADLSEEDPDARADVIRQLDEETPDSVPLLEQVVRTDEIARNRLLAVNSLRLMAKRLERHEHIAAVLRAAMTDSDPNVARSARDAYGEIAP